MNYYNMPSIAERRRRMLEPFSFLHPFVCLPFWIKKKSFISECSDIITSNSEGLADISQSDYGMIRVIFKQGVELRFEVEDVGLTVTCHYIIPDRLAISSTEPSIRSFTNEGQSDHDDFKIIGGLTLWEEMPFHQSATPHDIISLLRWTRRVSSPHRKRTAVVFAKDLSTLLIKCRFGCLVIVKDLLTGRISSAILPHHEVNNLPLNIIDIEGYLLSNIPGRAAAACAKELNNRLSNLPKKQQFAMNIRKNANMYNEFIHENFALIGRYQKKLTKGAISNVK